MYAPPAFKPHPAVALAFAQARGFGLVVTCDAGRPVASLLPFELIEADGKVPRALFHVARGNPLAALAVKGGNWLLAVHGHDAYVSPDWYASAEQVPTWLYESVQLGGPVRVVPAEHAGPHLDRLSARFEAWLAPKRPWTIDKVSSTRVEMLTNAITVIEMVVETVEGAFKLNQHKTDADNVAVAGALARQADPAAREIAGRMVALRPQLSYQEPGNGPSVHLAGA